MKPEALPSVSLLALLFGTTLVASRFAVGQFPPLAYVGLRLTVALLCYAALFGLSRKRAWPRDRRVWRYAPVLGVLGTAVPMSLIVGALQYLSSGVTSLLITLGPGITVLIAHFALPEERLTRRTAVGILLALAGAALLALLGETGLPDVTQANPLGYAMILGAHLAGAAAIVYGRRTLRGLDTVDVAAVRVLSALLVILPLALLGGAELGGVTAVGWGVLIYAALCGTFLALLLETRIIQRYGATATAMTANLIPIVALVAGALLLGEVITPGMIAAMVLIIGGMSIVTWPQTAVAAAPPT